MSEHNTILIFRKIWAYTHEEVAGKIGTSVEHYKRLEKRKESPTTKQAIALSSLYKVDESYFEAPPKAEPDDADEEYDDDEKTGYDSLDPYEVIRLVFDAVDFKSFAIELDQWLEAAIEEGYCWLGGTRAPVHSLLVHDEMVSLIKAAHTIWLETDLNSLTDLTGEKTEKSDIKSHFITPDDYPRLLSTDEWRNPILFINRFFSAISLKLWLRRMHQWQRYVLSNNGACEYYGFFEIMSFSSNLHKLLEISYLLLKLHDLEKSGASSLKGGKLTQTDPFTSICVKGACAVFLHKSEVENSLEWKSEMPGHTVKYFIMDGALTIVSLGGSAIVDVYYTELSEVQAFDNSKISMGEHFTNKELKVHASNSGMVFGGIKVKRLNVLASKSAEVSLHGEAKNSHLESYHNSSILAAKLQTQVTVMNIRDEAKGRVCVTKTLEYAKSEEAVIQYFIREKGTDRLKTICDLRGTLTLESKSK